MLLFSTDGLGDAVDPAQIFASPNSAGVLAELVGFPILPPKTSTNAVTAESSAAEGGREGGGVGSAYPNLHDTTLATLPDLPDEDTLSLAMGAGSLSLADDKTIGESWISFARKVPLAAVKIGALKDIILNIVISNNEDTQYEECSDDEEEKEKRWEGGKGDTTSTSADKQKLKSKEEILDALVEQDFGDGPSEIKSPPRDSSVVLSSLKPSYSFRNRPGSKVYNTEVVYGPNDKKQRIKLQQDALSPQNVVDKCTEFALKITSGERDLYSQPEFMQQSSWIKRELSDMSKTQWIKSHPTPDSCDWASGDRERFRKPKFLNPFIIPFAKMDHISVQCISPSILLTDSKN